MKSYSFRVILWLSVLVLAVSTSAGGAQKIRLAVLDVTSDSKLVQQSGIIADTFTGTLAKSGAVALAERQELETVIREQKISASELEEAAPRIGSIMGCQYMLLCSVKYEDSPVVAVRLVDTETTEVVYSDTELPDALDRTAVTAAGSRMADRLLEVLAGEQAVITELRGWDITINRGSSSGVRAGNMYRVYMGTKRNPVNLAVIRVKQVHSGFSTAEIVKNGGNISVLRRSDNIEAVSEKEAASLTRRKFTKKRPGEKEGQIFLLTSLNKLIEPLKTLSEDFAMRAKTSVDIIMKQLNGLRLTKDDLMHRNYDPKKLYKLGEGLGALGLDLGREKYSLLSYIKSMFGFFDDAGGMGEQEAVQMADQIFGMMSRASLGLSAIFYGFAAETGYVYAQNDLGFMYYLGYGYIYDLIKDGHEDRLASMFDRDILNLNKTNINFNEIIPPKPDYTKAAELFTKSATQGNTDAQSILGIMYLNGQGVKQDYKKALELLTKTASKGKDNALNALGYMYLQGLGVKKDYKKAFAFFNKAASRNNSEAYNVLANMYLNSWGVPKDVRKALELLRKAAALGHEEARKTLNALGAN